MTAHLPGLWFPIAIGPLLIVLSVWNVWRVTIAYRARGRRFIEQKLQGRSETLVAIKEIPHTSLYATAGLTAVAIFEVSARTAQGEERTYQWAYAPRVFPWQTEGVQRLAHGIWIPA